MHAGPCRKKGRPQPGESREAQCRQIARRCQIEGQGIGGQKHPDPKQVEHDTLHACIREDKPINNAYYTGLTELVTNRCLRETMLKLFFQTSRMWLVSLPELDWDEVIVAVSDELDELTRLIHLEDPIGLGLAARNHVFMARRRILSGLGLSLKETRNPI